jgi:hypothetical protein
MNKHTLTYDLWEQPPSLQHDAGHLSIILAPKSGHNLCGGIEEHATVFSYMHHTTTHGNDILFSPAMQTLLASDRFL